MPDASPTTQPPPAVEVPVFVLPELVAPFDDGLGDPREPRDFDHLKTKGFVLALATSPNRRLLYPEEPVAGTDPEATVVAQAAEHSLTHRVVVCAPVRDTAPPSLGDLPVLVLDIFPEVPSGIPQATTLGEAERQLARVHEFALVFYVARAGHFTGSDPRADHFPPKWAAERDRLVFEACGRAGVPLVWTLGPGWWHYDSHRDPDAMRMHRSTFFACVRVIERGGWSGAGWAEPPDQEPSPSR